MPRSRIGTKTPKRSIESIHWNLFAPDAFDSFEDLKLRRVKQNAPEGTRIEETSLVMDLLSSSPRSASQEVA